jgi:hypothetical protein
MSLKRHSHAGVIGPPAQRVRGNKGTANAQADTTKKASQRGKDKAADTSDVGGGGGRTGTLAYGAAAGGCSGEGGEGAPGMLPYEAAGGGGGSGGGGTGLATRRRTRRNWVGDAAPSEGCPLPL